jgi:hypothetical protein
MAMHLRAVKNPAAGPDPVPVAKHDAYVAAQLRRAEHRIRTLDIAGALLGFLALSCAVIGGAVLADILLPGFTYVRPFVLPVYLLAAVIYLALTLARPLMRRINPYYAALRMERTTPGAKNSVVNWLDLHEAKLPPAIRNSLGQRAAKDLARADVEKAFSGKRTTWLGIVAGIFFGLLVVQLFWVGPGDFFFHARRSFAPSAAPPTRTTLTVVQPARGNATVTAGKPVRIVVQVGGKVPDPGSATALMLHYRYDESDPYTTHWLQQDATGEWSHSFSALEVRDGFLYKITGGDAETPEYQIKVQSSPLVREIEATYRYRPYTARLDDVVRRPQPFKIETLRGTEVTLYVRTNRTLKEALIEFEDKDGAERVVGTIAPKDPKAFQVRFVVDHSANYRLHFTSTENEVNESNKPQHVVAIPDSPPNPVELTVPGKDMELPCNGLLQLEGRAKDDIGVKRLTLQMRVVNGPVLEGKKYRSDGELALPGGGYPRELSYKDAIDLAKVKSSDGAGVQLQAGMDLEYWLEARDACDYPQPEMNKTESAHFHVKLLPPETDEKKRQEERDRAKQEQQQHDQKQNEELKKENDKRQEEKKQQEEKNNAEQQANNTEKKNGGQGDAKDGSGDEQKKNEDLQDKLDKINKADKNRDEKAKPKDDPKKEPGESKGDGTKEQPNPADAKQQPKPSEQKDTGDSKGSGEKTGQPMEQPSRDKGEGSGNPTEQKASPKNDSAQQPNGDKSDAKPQGQPDKRPEPAESKEGGTPDQKQQSADNKPDKVDPKEGADKSESKQGNPTGSNTDAQPASENKDKPEGAAKAQDKPEEKSGADKEPKAAEKQGANAGQGDKSPEGAAKSDEKKPENGDLARGDAKDDAKKGNGSGSKDEQRNATPEDVKKHEKALENGDRKKQEDAAKALDQIKDQAKDPQARQDAEKALEKWNERNQAQPAEAKAPPKDQQEKPGDEKQQGPGDTKPGEQKRDTPSGQIAKGDKKDRGQEDKRGSDQQPGDRTDVAQAKPEQKSGPGQPGSGPPKNNNQQGPSLPEPDPKNEKSTDNKATTLQLEDIRKKLDKEMLEELKWTEEDKERFLKDLAEAMKKQQANKEKVAAPQNSGALPSIGARRVTSGDVNDLGSRDKALPPPEYRSAFPNFLQDLNKTEKKDK